MRHAPLAISRRRTRSWAWLLLIPTLSVCSSDTANGPVAAESDASARRSSILGTVTNLSASAPGASSVTLSFTQVSNGAGGPAKYDVRYAPSPINWGTATSVTNGTCATPVAGSAPGATLTCTVLGLAASTKYDFRLIAFRGTLDVDAVFGGLSNVATATTTAATTAGPASVTLTPTSATIALGERQTLMVAVKDQNGNTMTGQAVTWSSSNPTSVSVTSGGLITGVAAGSATITATSSGISGTSVITVIAPPPPTPTPTTLSVSPSSASIVVGATQALSATVKDQNGNVMTGQTVTWSSSNSAMASVNGSGVVTGVGAGSATITAMSSNITGSSSITVTAVPPTPTTVTVSPSTASIVVGATQALAATVKDQYGNVMNGQTVTWASSNTAVATVSSSGMVSGVAAGTATIAATSSGKTGMASVTVTAVSPVPTTVTVSPSSASIVAGATQALTATVKDQNGNVMAGQTVTWSSSNTAAATVDGSGVVTGVAAGSATITASSSGKSGTATVTVTAVPPVPTTVTVSPSSASIVAGATQALAATVKDQNGNVMTGQTVTWSSSNTAAATVNGSGVVTGVAAGSATITATSSGKSGTASVTVTAVPPPPPTPTTVTVAPSSASILAGATQAFTATVKDQNGNVMTGQTVTWASSNTAVATVSSSGLATGVAAGSGTITATSSGKSGTASITVTAPPPPPPPGGTLLFQENFEDANLASRGWYDNTVPLLSTVEHVAGSTASAQFHWTVGATVPQTGSGGFRHKFTPSNSFYVSYYVKYSTNWVGSGRPYHPHEFYISSTLDGDWDGPGDSYLTVYLEHNYQNGGLPVVGLQDSKSINKSYGPLPINLIGVTENRAVAGCNGVSEVNLSGGCYTSSGLTGYSNGITVTGRVVFSPTPGAPGYKNNWNHVEAYYQMNSIVNGIGQADGVMQYWFNGQLVIDRRDMVFRTGAHATMQFNHFMMAPYIGDGSPADQYMWVDNLKVATSPIP